jgi:hypothetical protein
MTRTTRADELVQAHKTDRSVLKRLADQMLFKKVEVRMQNHKDGFRVSLRDGERVVGVGDSNHLGTAIDKALEAE